MPEAFFEALAGVQIAGCFNPWRDPNDDDAPGNGPLARLERLRAHFTVHPELVLIGEAPGYQGARCSGVAFTNEALLLDGAIPRCCVSERLSTRARPWREPSATVVWSSLYREGIAERTWMFNAFPLHPYGDNRLSNRAPSRQEVDAGAEVVDMLLRARGSASVAAVGNTAAEMLKRMGVTCAELRHPAYGGVNAFRAGMAACCRDRVQRRP